MPRVIKIGLVAPFEGTYRSIGYDAIYAARLAVTEINAAGGANGWQLELVAYDDRADAQNARTIAHNLSIDDDVVAVIGHYRQASTVAAAQVYAESDIPLLAIGGWLTSTQTSVWQLVPSPQALFDAQLQVSSLPITSTMHIWDENSLLINNEHTYIITPYPLPSDVANTTAWREAYQAVGPHVPEPGPYALPTYDAVYFMAQAITIASQKGSLTRDKVADVVSGIQYDGLLGAISWDENGYWATSQIYTYQWIDGAFQRQP